MKGIYSQEGDRQEPLSLDGDLWSDAVLEMCLALQPIVGETGAMEGAEAITRKFVAWLQDSEQHEGGVVAPWTLPLYGLIFTHLHRDMDLGLNIPIAQIAAASNRICSAIHRVILPSWPENKIREATFQLHLVYLQAVVDTHSYI